GLVAGGEAAADAHEAEHVAVGVGHELFDGDDQHLVLVFAVGLDLDDGDAVVGEAGLVGVVDAGEFGGVELQVVEADDLVGAQSEVLEVRLVAVEEAAVGVLDVDPVGGFIEDRREDGIFERFEVGRKISAVDVDHGGEGVEGGPKRSGEPMPGSVGQAGGGSNLNPLRAKRKNQPGVFSRVACAADTARYFSAQPRRPACSSGASARRTLAGVPATIDPAGMTVRGVTTAPAAIRQRSPICAPSRMTAPMPIRHSSPMVQACTMALWPTVT